MSNNNNNTDERIENQVDALAAEPETQGQPEPQAQVTQEQPEVEDLPEKYRGKSLKEVVQMHQELEKMSGKHSNELGELRKITDQLIEAKNATLSDNTPSNVEFDEDAYWSNPKETITNTIDKHPSVQEAKKLSQELKQEKAQAQLQRNHPDYMQIVQDDKFQEWVGKSKVRTELLRKADAQYDADSANELFDLWKERADYIASKKSEADSKNKSAVKSASVGSANGSGEGPTSKFLSRRKINDMMRNNPREYAKRRMEIARAYAEGRVKA